MSYVVKVERRISGHESSQEYLTAIGYDPYQRGSAVRVTSPLIDDAFKFEERAAAEFAAVFVGGSVEQVS